MNLNMRTVICKSVIKNCTLLAAFFIESCAVIQIPSVYERVYEKDDGSIPTLWKDKLILNQDSSFSMIKYRYNGSVNNLIDSSSTTGTFTIENSHQHLLINLIDSLNNKNYLLTSKGKKLFFSTYSNGKVLRYNPALIKKI